MKKTINFLTKAVYVLAGIILLYLTLSSMHFTFLPLFREDTGFVCEGPDSRLRNLIVIAIVFLVTFILSKLIFIGAKTSKDKEMRVKGFLIADILIVGSLLTMYVRSSHIEPYWDQAQVLNDAIAFLHGDYSDMANTYLHKFPQQLGLIFFEIPFLYIWENFGIFQYLNVVFILLTIYGSYLISREMFSDDLISLLTIIASSLFFPSYVYVNFVYGDLPSIAGCIFIALMIIKWWKKNKSHYLAWAILLSIVFTLIRENVLIFLIASAIVIVLTSLRNKKYLALVAAVLILALPVLANKGVLHYFENKSGEIIDNPIPSISWMAMGLQGDPDEGVGVGYYNGYNEATWWYQGATTEAAKEFVGKEMKERIDYMVHNPSLAHKFFRYKILEQWVEPSFDSLYMTVTNYETAGEWAVKFYESDYPERMINFMNRYMSVVYFFGFVYMIYAFRHEVSPAKLVLIIAFIGGFLFSIIWEAKGRYAMPYFVFLLPIAASGLGMLVNLVSMLISRFVFRKEVNK